MDYYHLKSIISSGKKTIPLMNPTESFSVRDPGDRPYIEPEFEKVVFEAERPPIVLVSAVGASGKTQLACELSKAVGLPVLDLGVHKPVGDNTLTGIITSSFPIEEISKVLIGLKDGSYGLIIDGLDEGRSKTKEKAFEAFLDNILGLVADAPRTVVLMLGRSQALEETWEYLVGKSQEPGVIAMRPFSLDKARSYIDAFTSGQETPFASQYSEVRDHVLSTLRSAFVAEEQVGSKSFLSFVGYPPVLDAVATLLREEGNYHGLMQRLQVDSAKNREIELLLRISQHIMERDRREKVLPNFANKLIAKAPPEERSRIDSQLYSMEEQAVRLVAHSLGKQIQLGQFQDATLDTEYEEVLESWLPDHPFLEGERFRNVVFEAVCLAALIVSKNERYHELASEYLNCSKSSYHLVYMVEIFAGSDAIPSRYLGATLLAANEFMAPHTQVEQSVTAMDLSKVGVDGRQFEIAAEIAVSSSTSADARSFDLAFSTSKGETIVVGPYLANLTVVLSNPVEISGADEIEVKGFVHIEAKRLNLKSPSLVIHPQQPTGEADAFFAAEEISTSLRAITTNGYDVTFATSQPGALPYPLSQYSQQKVAQTVSAETKDRYIRLKRILLEFRSHSKGSLAKYRDKIEHERVLRNDIGKAILQSLLADGVLQLRGRFYHLIPEGLNQHLGVSWSDLRRGLLPESLIRYLQKIDAS